MTHSSTWPPLLLERLTELADLQEFDHLWIKLLRLCFPASFSFKIKVAKDENTSEKLGYYYIVSHGSRPSPCLLLTWHPSAKLCCNDPYRHFTSEAKRFGRHVHRLHAIGTRISSYDIESFATRHDGRLMYRPTPLPGFVESRYDMADVDILEPLGYQRLMARIKMAWVEAGVPWSAPNFNLSASGSSHHGGRLTNWQVPAADSHCHIPSTSVTGSSSGKGVAVLQPCGRQDVGIHVVGLMPSQASSFHKFPAELILEILEHVSTSDLRSFALSSTIYNDLAGRRLWRKFVIAGNSTEEVAERCTALLRLPSRAGRVCSLVVGHGRWTWTPDLLHGFQHIWPTLPRLVDLTLNSPRGGFGRCMARLGCSLEPLIRGLLLHAQSFRLRSFTYEGWLWPQSPLHMFLCAQPSIEALYGVDVFATRPLPHSPQFLPSLRALGCLRVETALFFLPNRGIHKLSVSDKIARDSDLILLTEALEACNGALNRLCLSVLQWPPQDQLERFAKLLCQVRMLILGGNSDFSSPFPFTLPALEELDCMVVRGYEADPARLAIFASQFGPKLRRIYFFARGERHTWLKEDGTESQFYLATGSVPQPTIVYV